MVYAGPGKVEVESIDYRNWCCGRPPGVPPINKNRPCPHRVILKVVATGAYGYVDMSGWRGGQAEYVVVPYADWNTLKFADRDRAMEKCST